MAGRQRTTFAKLQKERARQEKQAAKRARRQGLEPEPVIEYAPTADLNDPSTWKYADEIEAEKKEAAAAAAAESTDAEAPAPASTDAGSKDAGSSDAGSKDAGSSDSTT